MLDCAPQTHGYVFCIPDLEIFGLLPVNTLLSGCQQIGCNPIGFPVALIKIMIRYELQPLEKHILSDILIRSARFRGLCAGCVRI